MNPFQNFTATERATCITLLRVAAEIVRYDSRTCLCWALQQAATEAEYGTAWKLIGVLTQHIKPFVNVETWLNHFHGFKYAQHPENFMSQYRRAWAAQMIEQLANQEIAQ